jgi:hypothetical protein
LKLSVNRFFKDKQNMPNVPRTIVDALPPTYASHFLLTLSEGCLLIEASAGLPAGDGGKSSELPVHCRLAVPWPAAQRLATVLNTALAQHAMQAPEDKSTPASDTPIHAAKLPSLEV